MAFDSSWVIGSQEDVPDQTITVNATPYVLSGSSWYLHDSNDSLNWMAQLEGILDNEVANASVRLSENRHVRITADDAFAIIWSDSTETRDAMGFNASVGSTTDIVATNISPLFWSPSWPERPATPDDIDGWTVKDTVTTSSPSGQTVRTTQHWESTLQEFDWAQVPIDRIWTVTPGLGGEYRRFFDDVLEPGVRFKLYSDVLESASSTTDAVLGDALGPYKLRGGRRNYAWYNRAIPNADQNTNIKIRCQVTDEYS